MVVELFVADAYFRGEYKSTEVILRYEFIATNSALGCITGKPYHNEVISLFPKQLDG